MSAGQSTIILLVPQHGRNNSGVRFRLWVAVPIAIAALQLLFSLHLFGIDLSANQSTSNAITIILVTHYG